MARPKQLHRYRFTTPRGGHLPINWTPLALFQQAEEGGLLPDIRTTVAVTVSYETMVKQALRENLPPAGNEKPARGVGEDDEPYEWVYWGENLTWVGNAHRLAHYFADLANNFARHPENKGQRPRDGGWGYYDEHVCQQTLDWLVRNKWIVKELL